MLTRIGAGRGHDAPDGYAADRPEPAAGDGRATWVVGDCWLWCERTDTAVLWLGPVISWGTHAPLYACDDCIGRLEEQVREGGPSHRDAVCWLWCGRGDVPLVPLAEVGHRGGTTVFHACEECIGRIKQKVLALAMVKDAAKR